MRQIVLASIWSFKKPRAEYDDEEWSVNVMIMLPYHLTIFL